MKKPPLVEIRWHDAFMRSSSATAGDAIKDDDYAVRYTVGWLVHDSETKVIVAMSYDPPAPGEEAEYDDRYTIPKQYVQQIRYVRKPRAAKKKETAA